MLSDVDQDLSIPGSYPSGMDYDAHSQPRVTGYDNVTSGPQDMSQSMIDFAQRSQEGEATAIDEEIDSFAFDSEYRATDAKTSTGRKIMEHTAFNDTTNSPYDVQNELSTFAGNDLEAVVQEIRDITDAAERRRRVVTVPVVAKSDEPFPMSNIFCEMIDSEGRGIEDEPQFPDHDTVPTDTIVEDRLLADYLHSRSQLHHENESASSLVHLSNVKSNTALENTHQSTEDWSQHDITSSETLATSSRVELQPKNIRSDMTMEAESAGDISSQRSETAADDMTNLNRRPTSIAGSRPRRNSRPYYGRAVCSVHPMTGEVRSMESNSSDQPEARTTSSQASTFNDAPESSPVIRPRHRSHVLVGREELALKLQNIQEKTRDNRLAVPPAGELEDRSSVSPGPSVLSALKPWRSSSTSRKVPRAAVVPAASIDRRARGNPAIVRFSVSQDDLIVDFQPQPVQLDDEALEDETLQKSGGENQTSQVPQPKKVGLLEKLRSMMAGETCKKKASRTGGDRTEVKQGPNG